MRRKILGAMLGVIGLALGGCSLKLGDSTSGELGRVDFSYTSGCLFGCSMNRSLLVGTDASISVTSVGNDPGVSADSSAPGVAAFDVERDCTCDRTSGNSTDGYGIDAQDSCQAGWTKECENTIHVTALAEGDAELQLKDQSGKLIDRTPIYVRAPSSVSFEQDGKAGDALQVKVGQTTTIFAQFTDPDGRDMIATAGVTWTSADPNVAGFPSPMLLSPAVIGTSATRGASVELTGVRAGATEIELRAQNLDRKIPITVVK